MYEFPKCCFFHSGSKCLLCTWDVIWASFYKHLPQIKVYIKTPSSLDNVVILINVTNLISHFLFVVCKKVHFNPFCYCILILNTFFKCLSFQVYKELVELWPIDPLLALNQLYEETVEISLRLYFPFQASNEEKQQRWSRGRVWKTGECAEAAELLSGLVAAVIILMLVVKPLWAGGGWWWRGGGGLSGWSSALHSPQMQSYRAA